MNQGSYGRDVHDMHDKFGHGDAADKMTSEQLAELLQFRERFMDEETRERKEAETPEDYVDAIIDNVVVELGTLDLLCVDWDEAWRRVHVANMSKENGVNSNRVNESGMPDLCKPEGFVPPDHSDNVGVLPMIWQLHLEKRALHV